jgi:cytochrome c553
MYGELTNMNKLTQLVGLSLVFAVAGCSAPEGMAMKAITHSLTPENMANVAAYLETLSSASATKSP